MVERILLEIPDPCIDLPRCRLIFYSQKKNQKELVNLYPAKANIVSILNWNTEIS